MYIHWKREFTYLRDRFNVNVLTLQPCELEKYIERHFKGYENKSMQDYYARTATTYLNTLFDSIAKEDMRHPNILFLVNHPYLKPYMDLLLNNLR